MSEQKISSRDVLIQAEDLEAACAFYEDTLGLTVFLHEKEIIGFEAGAFRLFVERGPKYGPVFEFFVDDLEAVKARLVAAGCRVEIEDAGVPKCYVKDAFGLVFNLAVR